MRTKMWRKKNSIYKVTDKSSSPQQLDSLHMSSTILETLDVRLANKLLMAHVFLTTFQKYEIADTITNNQSEKQR